jgi:hypothetical protein
MHPNPTGDRRSQTNACFRSTADLTMLLQMLALNPIMTADESRLAITCSRKGPGPLSLYKTAGWVPFWVGLIY